MLNKNENVEVENVETTIENFKNKKTDLTFYKPDKMAYNMVMLATVLELVYLVVMLGLMELNYVIGIFILVNICFLLLLFTIALEVKVYKPKSSVLAIIFGTYALSRIVIVPFVLGVTDNLVLLYIICGSIGALMIGAGIMNGKKVVDQIQYKKDGKINAIQVSK